MQEFSRIVLKEFEKASNTVRCSRQRGGILDDVIFLDLETTGLDAEDEIIEIGALKFSGGKTETYSQLVNPAATRISPRIFNLCRGLTAEELRAAPPFAAVKEEFLEFIGDYPLLCHNAGFEKRMLARALGKKLGNTMLDTLELFVLFKPQFERHGLDFLMQHYLEESRPEAHRALADAQDTAKLVFKLLAELEADNSGLLSDTLELMQNAGWEWLPYLESIAPALRSVTERAPYTAEAEPRCAYTLAQITELLENEEYWHDHFPAYFHRPQQLQMATLVAEAFRHHQALFVEAPTGSGKTIGYLLPAVIWAVQEKEKVFISTNTKNLQQQVLNELAAIGNVLGIEDLRCADLKGISNYLCRRQIGEEAKQPGTDLEAQLARCYLLNWSKLSPSGEEEDISYWLKMNNSSLKRLANLLRCRKEDCSGSACDFRDNCFYNLKVRKMESSHLCTINHALLLTWPGSFPEINKLIIDEAHTLEDKAFVAFTRELKATELAQFLDKLVQGERKGYLNFLKFHSTPPADTSPALRAIENIRNYAAEIQVLLEPLRAGDDNKRCAIPDDNEELHEAATSLAGSLATLAESIEETLTAICEKDEDFENSNLYQQGSDYLKICRAWSGVLQECFADEKGQDSAYYLECHQYGWSFCIAPLDIAEPFYAKVIANSDALLLTSATLAEKGTYERPVRALGFDRLEKEQLVYEPPLPQVYAYTKNSVLAIPSDSPGYKSPAFIDYTARAVLGAAAILKGRTMVLCSSLARMEKVMAKVRAPLEQQGISVLGGKNTSKRAELEHFKEDQHAVLFGSRGYFEGVDIKGPALSCVIIDKLSFAYYQDPLHQARADYMKSKGLDPFTELTLVEVIKTVRQQFGRLIRSESDQGVVLVLDQLGSGKRYCEDIVQELPAPRVLSELRLDELLDKMEDIFEEWGY